MAFYLLKSEPDVFSFDDLIACPDRTTGWDGVRNYQARNLLRDGFRPGDGVLFYHSNATPSALVGVGEVVEGATADPTALDPLSPFFDPKSTADRPVWLRVLVRATHRLIRPLPLAELRLIPELTDMALLRKGSRLSVQPVTADEWTAILALGNPMPL